MVGASRALRVERKMKGTKIKLFDDLTPKQALTALLRNAPPLLTPNKPTQTI